MIYLAVSYVLICAVQLGFQIWRDLGEVRRRKVGDAHHRRLSAESAELAKAAEESQQRMAASIELMARQVEKLEKRVSNAR